MRGLAVTASAIVLAGCGAHAGIQATKLPLACAAGPGPLLKALRSAPAQVRVDGQPLSHCFAKNQSATDVQLLGQTLVAAAQRLGDRSAVDRESALELGYLIGAARRGSERNGVTAELVRRLEDETGTLGANRVAYERGLRAGLAKG